MEATRAAVARASRRLAEQGLVVGTAGNVSARVPGTDVVAVTGTGVVLADCTAADVVCVGPGDSPAEATSELELHRLLYARTDARAVVHRGRTSRGGAPVDRTHVVSCDVLAQRIELGALAAHHDRCRTVQLAQPSEARRQMLAPGERGENPQRP